MKRRSARHDFQPDEDRLRPYQAWARLVATSVDLRPGHP